MNAGLTSLLTFHQNVLFKKFIKVKKSRFYLLWFDLDFNSHKHWSTYIEHMKYSKAIVFLHQIQDEQSLMGLEQREGVQMT